MKSAPDAVEAVDSPTSGTEADSRLQDRFVAPATAIPVVVLLLDQLTKAWVRAELTLGEPVRVIGDWVRLLYIHNEGAAFGLHVGRYSPTIFLIVASVVSLAVLVLYVQTPLHLRLERVALAMILGGALGNIIDRIRWQRVVDFLQVGVDGHYWPIFNVADSAVTIGVVLLAYEYLFRR
ncbi:MAG: signal peptidase II [Gemmatimonadota bacterium]|nr:signal peptidase II [Gemmatimonadota bacterium]